jgi:hypothetical protein
MNATPLFGGGWVRSTISGGGGTYTVEIAVDPAITSWAELGAVATVALPVGSAKAWVEATTEILKVVVLRTSDAATDTASGLKRPDDYNGTTNAKVWHQSSV